MQADLTTELKIRDANCKAFLSLCFSLQTPPVINAFEEVQLADQRSTAEEMESEGTSEVSLQKLTADSQIHQSTFDQSVN